MPPACRSRVGFVVRSPGRRTGADDIEAGAAATIRLLVVDHHEASRAALCERLARLPGLKVVGQAGSGQETLRLCRACKPAVAVVDYCLPDLDGLELTREVLGLGTNTRVLIVAMHANEEYAIRVIRAGASGFIVKAAPAVELLGAIRKVAERGVYVSPSIVERMVNRLGAVAAPEREAVLSDRELQVLIHLARGSTSRKVAEALRLSVSTVETYRRRVLDKLGLRSNADMTRFAIQRGLIEAP